MAPFVTMQRSVHLELEQKLGYEGFLCMDYVWEKDILARAVEIQKENFV